MCTQENTIIVLISFLLLHHNFKTYLIMVEDLQKVADLITAKLNAIERYSLLSAKNVLNLDDVAMLTGLSKSHLYKLTCNKQIPHYKPNTKAMYFDRVEIEEWMKQNRVTTQAEAEQKAVAYVVKKGGTK